MYLPHEPFLGCTVERPVDEPDDTASALQLFDHDVLIGVMPCQAVRGEDEHAIEFSAPGGIAQPIQGRPIQPGAAVAVIDVVVFRGNDQPRLSRVGRQRGQLALDRALFLLLRR